MVDSNAATTDTNAGNADDSSTLMTADTDPSQTATGDAGTGEGQQQTTQKPGEQGTQGDQKTDDKPVEYSDFTLPDGQKLDDYAESVTLAKELGLDQDKAQKLIDYEAKQRALAIDEGKKSQETLVSQRKHEWLQAAQKDPEIGGDKLMKEHVPQANKARIMFGTAEFSKILESTGMGNHPEFIRVFSRIGQAISEDAFIQPTGNTGQAKTRAERIYKS